MINELYDSFRKQGRDVQLLSRESVLTKTEAVNEKGLLGALYSSEELIVDPREAISILPCYLSEKLHIEFYWGKCVSYIADQTVYIGNDEEHEADLIFVCGGADFETLYPEYFSSQPITRCKLQMMRFEAQPGEWRIGPALCAGLSLIHYKSFAESASLDLLKKRFLEEMPLYLEHGIHVMVSQNGLGELTVGDSHEYGQQPGPFDKTLINQLIVDYLKQFARFRSWNISETWNGIYPKLTDGETDLFFSPEPQVYIINGVGGAGMTLSFGLAEELVAGL